MRYDQHILKQIAIAASTLCTQAIMNSSFLFAQQINIPRIEQMPNRPSPYLMRDWKQVARGYDSLVFNLNLTGTYLPLASINTSTVNYPAHPTFGLHTVVGTTVPSSAEAVNCLPALVGAHLVGIDKSNQPGYNWVLMAEEWFNRRSTQNVYKNHPVDDTGDDWWYETMPNVFFYQLSSSYPTTGDFPFQFTTVADRWLQATQAMGGSATPWQIPNMDHRGWYLQTMTPYNTGVHEPEAAGAIAWILYMAYVRTHDQNYRIGAEWAMEFLNRYPSNPSYELQLAYGTYLASRMNAELGTSYDVGKMVNWCFDVGPLRSWGAMTGNWGGYDCSGLIGEVNGTNNYAFAMNTFEQVGALVPLVRYDDRFARAIGKWVLNAANASRLFYTIYLPDDHQDSEPWSHQYDSSSVIAHEALRQFNGGTSPYATGDAISGGWGATNLALYGSSHAGILGGIIETTNVRMVLKLDLLATDYFHDTSYPTFLFYNPHDSDVSIEFDAGPGLHDLYDAVQNSFIKTFVSGYTTFGLKSDSAAVIVVTPSGGAVTYDLDIMRVDGVVVDCRSAFTASNYPPRIKALAADRTVVLYGDTGRVFCTAVDRDHDSLMFAWRASGGSIVGSDSIVRWIAPDSGGIFTITCLIVDIHGAKDSASIQLRSSLVINHPPAISRIIARPRKIDLGSTTHLTCTAMDPDSDALTFNWQSDEGTVIGKDSLATWTAPSLAGNYMVRCIVSDGHGGETEDITGVEVRDFTQHQTGNLLAYYPFTGNAGDSSGNGNNGVVHGASLTPDRLGSGASAYAFNGSTSYIEISNNASLNFQTSISVTFWMKIGAFYLREQYPVSHGNWENRWKVSISNNRLRWTVKTTAGTKDLDSETRLEVGKWYHVAVCYSGSDFEVYLNGNLDAFSSWSGLILTTTINPTIGQVLPGNQSYNFNGVIDEVRIYDYALPMADIEALAGGTTGVEYHGETVPPERTILEQNYPNPFNPLTVISYRLSVAGFLTLKVFDLLGGEVATLVNERKVVGDYKISWDASRLPSGVYFYRLQSGSFSEVKKLILIR